MKLVFRTLAVALSLTLSLGGCQSTSSAPNYTLSEGEEGVFTTSNAGRPIPAANIKGMNEQQLLATFGTPQLDRKDGRTRVLRYKSDACTLFVFVSADRAQYADAYDPKMRRLAPADRCAGSVAAQKRSA